MWLLILIKTKIICLQLTNLFFMSIASENNIVSLMSWGDGCNNDAICYKVYTYTYNNNGDISKNIKVGSDKNLSGCEGRGGTFIYKNAAAIKSYINKTFNINH